MLLIGEMSDGVDYLIMGTSTVIENRVVDIVVFLGKEVLAYRRRESVEGIVRGHAEKIFSERYQESGWNLKDVLIENYSSSSYSDYEYRFPCKLILEKGKEDPIPALNVIWDAKPQDRVWKGRLSRRGYVGR